MDLIQLAVSQVSRPRQGEPCRLGQWLRVLLGVLR